MITSSQNPRIKAAQKLRDARQRRKQGRFIIDGWREILRALEAGVELVEVFVCEELCSSTECDLLMRGLAEPAAHTPDVIHVSRNVLAKLAFGGRADGVVGVATTPRTSLANLRLPDNPLIAVLEGVEKPGNVGAVLRSADGAGVSALIVADGGTDLYNPNAIRASVGTIFSVPVCAATSAETVAWMHTHKLAVYAACVDAEMEYTEADFTRPCAVVLGSEATGLTDQWRPGASSATAASSITPIHLPMCGVADSLNVSATAAVLFYEALRQRRGADAW